MLIRLGCPQSVVTLHIYRVGWSVPFRSRNPNKSCVKIQLLTRIGHFGQSDWSPNRSDHPRPVWPIRPGCRSFGRHNFLTRTPNWTFHICILIVSMRSMEWCSPIGILTTLPRPVWPVYTTSLTGSPRLSIKPLYLPILGVNTYITREICIRDLRFGFLIITMFEFSSLYTCTQENNLSCCSGTGFIRTATDNNLVTGENFLEAEVHNDFVMVIGTLVNRDRGC